MCRNRKKIFYDENKSMVRGETISKIGTPLAVAKYSREYLPSSFGSQNTQIIVHSFQHQKTYLSCLHQTEENIKIFKISIKFTSSWLMIIK